MPEGALGSRFLPVWKWTEASLLTQTTLTQYDVSTRQMTYVAFSCSVVVCVSIFYVCVCVCVCLRGMLVHTHVLVHILVADTGYGKAQLYPSDFGDVVHQLSFDLIPHRLPVCVSLSLSFSLSLCLFFVKINLRAMLSSQLATQRDMGCSTLSPHAMINVQRLALLKVCFSIQWDTKREDAFNTNATLCIT